LSAQSRFKVSVIGGCGHVGLPLAMALAKKGHDVCAYDIDDRAVETVRAGRMPFREAGAEQLLPQLLETRTLRVSLDPATVTEADIVIFTVGTPVDDHLNPMFQVIRDALDSVFPHFRDGQVLVLRSTVFPGISDTVRHYFDSRGKRVHVAFCPERIAEGHALTELETLPQIVSGFTAEAVEKAAALFGCLTPEIVHLQPVEAELAKLFTNVYRYINFAIANQFYQMANDYGLDFHRIHYAMTWHYPRSAGFPKSGLTAGPCLFKDTMQLSAFSNNNFILGHSAMLINEGLPNYIVQKLKALGPLKSARVGILGMAFKADSDDKRASLSYKLKRMLEVEAEEVLCSDPYIADPRFVLPEELIARADTVVLGAPHKQYAQLTFGDKRVVDIWNFYGRGGQIR
jgi:UDP-N-acetyl-D-mannosaminuronic acid dehydrogenase